MTELMEHGSLQEYLQCSERRSLKMPQLINMCAQVARGMAYLEENHYIHRSLSARNILIGEHMICKVADVGLGKVIDEEFYESKGAHFRIQWTAPEAILYNQFSIKSDLGLSCI